MSQVPHYVKSGQPLQAALETGGLLAYQEVLAVFVVPTEEPEKGDDDEFVDPATRMSLRETP